MKKQSAAIVWLAVISCAVMALVDGVIQPGYIVKSGIKLLLFLILPVLLSRQDQALSLRPLLRLRKKGLVLALLLGAGLYGFLVGGYLIFATFADFSAIAGALSDNAGIDRGNYLPVVLYVAFVNSLLEELFFRGFVFMNLKRLSSRRFAYCFSAGAFSVYHAAMMIGWFDWWLFVLVLAGLFVGGIIFNRLNEKQETVYTSWLVHMFSNFAINTIGYMLLH